MTRCVTHKSWVPTPKVKVPRLCSRPQPGIKVIIRDLLGHLLHTVTFLVFFMELCWFVIFSMRIRVSSVTFQPLKIFSQNMVQILYQSVDYIGSLAKFT